MANSTSDADEKRHEEIEVSMLTTEIVQKLRQPFPAEMVKWKIQTNPKDDDMALVVAYIDARDVAEWLDLATSGDWSTDYSIPQRAPHDRALECRLTVCGITRVDVGETTVDHAGEWSAKDLHSDAFKRAAVMFGVGAFLYRLPKVKAKAKQYGKAWFLTFDAQTDLLEMTKIALSGDKVPRFEHLRVSGSYQAPIELFD